MSGPASGVAPGAEANLTAQDVSLEVDLGKLKLRNPVLAASGAYGYGAEYTDFIENATIGGFVTKSVTPEAKRGNPHPRCAETPSGMLNSIGLENLGIDHFLEHEWPEVKKEPCTPILSVAAYSIEDYARMVAKVEAAGGADAIELNLSCPNVKEGGRTFGGNPDAVEEILSRCREETDTFLLAKLTPNADVVAIAQGAEAGGADGLTLINTLLGMGIDVERRTPLLAMGMGGLSGPAVKPVALAMTWQVRRVTALPIIGMGGISNWKDAVEFLLAGANAVQVGTALFANPLVLNETIHGIADYCARHGFRSVEEVRGALRSGDRIEEGKSK